jgi:biotin synthase-like enzyme
MSTQPEQTKKLARRSFESILAEIILCDILKWELGFLSGGTEAFSNYEFLALLKLINKIHKKRIWINIGPLNKKQLIKFKPYIKGVVGSIETINQKIHKKICPSKPIAPFEKMFIDANNLGLMCAMTIILGLGETIKDFSLLKNFIKRYKIKKIHFYSLNPQRGTIYENIKPPKQSYQAEWISRTRIEFPKIDIQAGIWLNRVNTVSLLLKAGANSISKFPALRYFNSKEARIIEKEAEKAGRRFIGSLTKLPQININEVVNRLNLRDELKVKIMVKLKDYTRKK